MQVYNEHKPRLAVSGWFHAAAESEMGDWPEHSFEAANGKSDAEGDGGAAASTLEQLKGAAAAAAAGEGGGGGDGPSSGVSFKDDFVGTEVRKNAHGAVWKRHGGAGATEIVSGCSCVHSVFCP